ncbi:hypothetical protein [Pedobacter sp. MC2016-24]|uniref:hypothetical protein n=1 Tax=Pedobacter sp. MC2016-24 TaxID=2780090 RepID=UPI00187EC1FE|nr:hypothetical protein [Pedobacter sp. MC2016-24]MBE9599100.1 hypothetical protein [Pedobacter sp. MC2016-24]
MLMKLSSISPTFARQKAEKVERPLTRQEWIKADRIVIALLFAATIVAAIIFS